MIIRFRKFGALCLLLTAVSFISGCSVTPIVDACRDSFNSVSNLVQGLPSNCAECDQKRAALEDALFNLRKCVNDACQRLGNHTCEQAPLTPEETKEGTKLCDKWKEIRSHCRSMGCNVSEWFTPSVCTEIEKLPATGAKAGVGAAVMNNVLGSGSITTKSTDGKVGWTSGAAVTSEQ
jgi:hypothetical protein